MVKITLIKDNREFIVYDDVEEYEIAEQILEECLKRGAVYVVKNGSENIYIDIEKYDIIKLMQID